jgi:agmatinase
VDPAHGADRPAWDRQRPRGRDPSVLPAVLAPAPGGLLYWQVLELLAGLAAKCRIMGFDLVEFMPSRDTTGIAALTAARLVCNAIAAIATSQKRG